MRSSNRVIWSQRTTLYSIHVSTSHYTVKLAVWLVVALSASFDMRDIKYLLVKCKWIVLAALSSNVKLVYFHLLSDALTTLWEWSVWYQIDDVVGCICVIDEHDPCKTRSTITLSYLELSIKQSIDRSINQSINQSIMVNHDVEWWMDFWRMLGSVRFKLTIDHWSVSQAVNQSLFSHDVCAMHNHLFVTIRSRLWRMNDCKCQTTNTGRHPKGFLDHWIIGGSLRNEPCDLSLPKTLVDHCLLTMNHWTPPKIHRFRMSLFVAFFLATEKSDMGLVAFSSYQKKSDIPWWMSLFAKK